MFCTIALLHPLQQLSHVDIGGLKSGGTGKDLELCCEGFLESQDGFFILRNGPEGQMALADVVSHSYSCTRK